MRANLEYEFHRRYGWEQIKREEYISNAQAMSNKRHPVFYQNKQEYFPLIRMPIELPMYRLENGRTASAQEEYIAQNPFVGDDYFDRDRNSIEVQEAQHSLLLDLVKSTELDNYFKENDQNGKPINIQRDPIICTPEGFVVNGNRRLCCWRELYYNDETTYACFKYIDAVILPVADEDAILELEADLQLASDIQENYSWHAEALMMQRKRDIQHESLKSIAKKFRKKSERDVELLINMRSLAGEYLAWRGPDFDRRWSNVSDNEYAFRELVIQMSRLNTEMDRVIFKAICFSIIRDSYSDSDYRRIQGTKKYYEKVIKDLKEEFKPTAQGAEVEDRTSSAIEVLLGGTPESSTEIENTAFASQIQQLENAEMVAEIASEAIDREKRLLNEKRKATYIIDQVRTANTYIQSALTADLGDSSLVTTGLQDQLSALESSINRLKEWLDGRETNN